MEVKKNNTNESSLVKKNTTRRDSFSQISFSYIYKESYSRNATDFYSEPYPETSQTSVALSPGPQLEP